MWVCCAGGASIYTYIYLEARTGLAAVAHGTGTFWGAACPLAVLEHVLPHPHPHTSSAV